MKHDSSGYSGTPLAKKLGIKDHFKIRLIEAPKYYMELFFALPRKRHKGVIFLRLSDERASNKYAFSNTYSTIIKIKFPTSSLLLRINKSGLQKAD